MAGTTRHGHELRDFEHGQTQKVYYPTEMAGL